MRRRGDCCGLTQQTAKLLPRLSGMGERIMRKKKIKAHGLGYIKFNGTEKEDKL